LEIDLENRGISDIDLTLLDKRYDATVCFDHLVPTQDRELLERCHLADIHRMVFFSVRHPFALRENLRFTDFQKETCVALRSHKHPEPERTIRAICAQYGFEPRFQFKPNHDSVIMSVQSGRGYCILDEWSRNRWSSRFQSLPLDFTRPVSIYWRKNNENPLIPVVVDALKELIQQL
jgi:DNA-binding transcriptional LysR family regulator